jgi:signal transduction histidine kinase
LVTIFNDAYAPSLGRKHPGHLGQPASEWWSEMWDQLTPIFDKVLAGGTFYVENAVYTPDRSGVPQEAYFTHCHSPLWDDEGRIAGIFLVVSETTRQVVAERSLGQANAELANQVKATQKINESLEHQVAERTAELTLYRNIVQSVRFPVCAYDNSHRVTVFNNAHAVEWLRVMGRPAYVGEVLPDAFSPEQAATQRAFAERALAGETFTVEGDFGDPDLAVPHWELDYAPVRDEAGSIIGAFHHARDVTERLKVQTDLLQSQEALRQSQKMEAVGQLTGGLAHDFNNLLTGVLGSLELLKNRIAQGRITDLERYVEVAQGAANRAAALTHRLLAFSRRQTLDPRPTDVAWLVSGLEEMVRRTVGPEIAVDTVGAADLWTTLVDPSQLENALLNLCINARDAMPDGGRISVEMANQDLDPQAAEILDMEPGEYVSLCVTDTGTGMPPEVVAKALDPFFTTKPIGMGTGLGLSMIYGFTRQSGGQVRIHSEVGCGTTVCLYLPRHRGDAAAHDPAPELAGALRAEAGQTVLVIDDEPTVRMLVTEVLGDLGYTAIEAADGAAGLKVLRSNVRIDLLVTDVGLPGGLNGRQVADAARVVRSDLKVLFITGYAENAVLGDGHLAPGMQVLTKPFQLEVLTARIKELIAFA